MIELVLDEAGEAAEFGNVFSEQADFVHGTENGRDISALIQDFQERRADVFVFDKFAIYEGELIADGLREIGMEPQTPLLHV
jgi:hypothetical protein